MIGPHTNDEGMTLPGQLILEDGRFVTPGGVIEGYAALDAGVIALIQPGARPVDNARSTQVINLGGRTVGPGFIDIHVHGGDGADVQEGDPEQLRHLARFLASHGVTAFLPSLVTGDFDETLGALRAVSDVVGVVDGGAEILGAHMEGPYLNPVRKGVHREHLLRELDWAELDELLSTGAVRLIAIAPEVGDHMAQIPALRERGVYVSAGHTDATDDQLIEAIDCGVTQVTHLFNGMRGFHHREPGTVGAALRDPRVLCELVSDGVHVDPRVIRLAWRLKGTAGIVLVSDAVPTAGRADGVYEQAGQPVHVGGGVMRLADGTICGSMALLDTGFATFCAAVDQLPEEVWPVVSANAARAIGVGDRKGSLSPGKDADLVVLEQDGSVALTVARGEVVFDAAGLR